MAFSKKRRRERYEVRDDDGPSDWIRTSGLMLPKHPRYQLRYTRMSSEETRFVPFPPDGENCTSAPSFFLSESNPLTLGFDSALVYEETRFVTFPPGCKNRCSGRGRLPPTLRREPIFRLRS